VQTFDFRVESGILSHHIQNPAAHFRKGKGIFATGFIIHEEK